MKLNVQDLIDLGLVIKKSYTEGIYKGLSVLKYHRKVFYNNLWHLDDRLLECRGTVVDEEWNVISLPFKKVFNLNENNTAVDSNKKVIVVDKLNGFLAAVTLTEKYGLVISTTGTLDSDYAILARKWIEKLDTYMMIKGITYLFEICDKSDPHVIEEKEGAYLIGVRRLKDGVLLKEEFVDVFGLSIYAPRPIQGEMLFKDIPKTKKEGFMVRCAETQETLCKLKSGHYLAKKAFMRMGMKRINLAWTNPNEFRKQIDEEFFDLHKYLVDRFTSEEYHAINSTQRRQIIEGYFTND